MKQPNILMIVADQHRQDCLGVSGHPLLKTPHLDALAKKGVNFRRAFTSSPICVPARHSLLHGVWPCKHLCIANPGTEAPRPPVSLPSFPQQLKKAGYDMSFCGKWVEGLLTPDDYGFTTWIKDSEYAKWREAQGLPKRPGGIPYFGCDEGVAPEQSHLWWGSEQAIGMLRKAAKSGKPFFVRWDPSEPHPPNVVPEPYASMYPPEDIKPYPSFGDKFIGKPYIQAQQLRSWKLDGWDWTPWSRIVSQYLGELTLLDTCVGRVLAELKALNLEDDTIVIYTCDHGDTCGAHGMIDKHYIMYDDVTHVPLLIYWPGAKANGSNCDAFVTHTIDLARSLCEWAGVEVPETFQGQSLLPLLQGENVPQRQDVLCAYYGNQFGLFSQRMLRDSSWKYVWNLTAEDELYDLENDIGELVNLATAPEHAERLASMRRRLYDELVEIGDNIINGWTRNQLLDGKKI